MKRWMKMGFAVLAVLLLCAACGGNKAATMWLRKTTGEVWVSDAASKAVELVEDMGLYSGYRLDTWAESYAWIDLDSVKLAKMDAESQVEIKKDGKDLEILVNTGSVFFNVTEPLEDDETMTIRTATLLVGIRGTCGWVVSDGDKGSQVYILEGTVEAEAVELGKTVRVSAGEMAEVSVGEDGKAEIAVAQFAEGDIAGFILEELDEEFLEEAREFMLSVLSGEELDAAFLEAFNARKGALSGSEEQIAGELETLKENTADSVLPLPEDYEAQYRAWRTEHLAELEALNVQLRAEYDQIIAGKTLHVRFVQSGLSEAYCVDLDGDGLDELILLSEDGGETFKYEPHSPGLDYAGSGYNALEIYGNDLGHAVKYVDDTFSSDHIYCEFVEEDGELYFAMGGDIQGDWWEDFYKLENKSLNLVDSFDNWEEAIVHDAYKPIETAPENICPAEPPSPELQRKSTLLKQLYYLDTEYFKLIDLNNDGVEELFLYSENYQDCTVTAYSWDGTELQPTDLDRNGVASFGQPALYRDSITGNVYFGTRWTGTGGEGSSFYGLSDSFEFGWDSYRTMYAFGRQYEELTPAERAEADIHLAEASQKWDEYQADLARFELIERINVPSEQDMYSQEHISMVQAVIDQVRAE